MISTKTLFVLGAGASVPYGLPTGNQLKKLIWNLADLNPENFERKAITGCGVDWSQFQEFISVFHDSRVSSIDDFLSRQMRFAEFGKLAIATVLLRHEQPDRLEPEVADGDWYSTLWQALIRGTYDASGLRSNAVRFISFNYDRSLEQFLHEATRFTFPYESSGEIEAIEDLPILHMYGQLGAYSFVRADSCVPYEHFEPNSNLLQIAANGIRVIPEARENDRAFSLARDWCDWAGQICFLGFGFDTLNLRRLGIYKSLNARNSSGRRMPDVFASTFNMTKSEIAAAETQIGPPGNYWHPISAVCLDTLRETGIHVGAE